MSTRSPRSRGVRIMVRLLQVVLVLLLAVPTVLIGLFVVANRTNGTLVVSGETRRYLLHVPESYDGTRAVPLVISLHGFAQWPANQESVSRWSDLSDAAGFIVVYPMGTGFPLRWAARAPGPAEASDVRFLTGMIDILERDYEIDPDRIFVNGISNGGGMAFALSCALSGRIAAIGTVAGLFLHPWEACDRERPVPLIAFHGTADPIVPYDGGPLGGPGGAAPSVRAWVADYAVRNGCGAALELPTRGAVTGTRWSQCDGDADVVLHTVEGGGHTWPGGNPLPLFITGPTTDDIDATREMWTFFQAHPLR